jgi:hypothetical protein
MRHIRLGQPEKLAMAEHKFETGQNIELGNITMLDKASGCIDLLNKGGYWIRLRSRNLDRDTNIPLAHTHLSVPITGR